MAFTRRIRHIALMQQNQGFVAFSGAECFPEKLSGKHRGNKGRKRPKIFFRSPAAAIMACYTRERPPPAPTMHAIRAQHEVIGNVHGTRPAVQG